MLSIPAPAVSGRGRRRGSQLGVRAVAVIAAGFGEDGRRGPGGRSDALVETARAAGGAAARARTASACSTRRRRLNATGGDQPAGGVSLVSQSGNLALEVGAAADGRAAGLRAVRVGRQPGRPDDRRRALVAASTTSRRGWSPCYVEDPSDGRGVRGGRAARWPRPASRRWCCKPPAAPTSAPRAAQLPHRLAGRRRRGCSRPRSRDAGGIPVATPGELVDARPGAARRRRASRGRRVAVLADGGGHGVLAADLLTDAGFELAPLGAATAAARAARDPAADAGREPGRPGRRGRVGRLHVRAHHRRAARRRRASTRVLSPATSAATRATRRGGGAGAAGGAAASPSCATRAASRCWCSRCRCPAGRPRSRRCDALAVPTYARIESAIRGLDAVARPRSAPRRRRRAGARDGGRPRDLSARRAQLLAAAGLAFPRRATWPRTMPRRRRIAALLGAPVALKAGGAGAAAQDRAGGVVLGVAPGGCRGRPPRRCGRGSGWRSTACSWSGWRRPAASTWWSARGAIRRSARSCWWASAGSSSRRSTTSIVTLAPADPGARRPPCCGRCARGRCWPAARGRRPVDVAAVARAAVRDRRRARPAGPIWRRSRSTRCARGDGVIALDARIVVA